MSKKVLHFRLDAPQYSSEFMRRGFIEAGYEYHGINWQQVKFDVGILGFQARAIAAAEQVQPDLIFIHIQSPGVLDIETCQSLTAIGFTCMYSFDVREDVAWMKELEPYLNMILVADQETANAFSRKGYVLQSSADIGLYYPITPRREYKHDISFIGSNYVNTNLNFPLSQERFDMAMGLKKEYGNNFLCKGMNWEVSEYIPPAKELEIYNASKIAISHNNFFRSNYTSDRFYRILACGCFCLTQYFPGIENMFERGIHLDWWHDFDELKDKINYYISKDVIRERIAKQGHEHFLKNHTWVSRVKELESLIELSKSETYGATA